MILMKKIGLGALITVPIVGGVTTAIILTKSSNSSKDKKNPTVDSVATEKVVNEWLTKNKINAKLVKNDKNNARQVLEKMIIKSNKDKTLIPQNILAKVIEYNYNTAKINNILLARALHNSSKQKDLSELLSFWGGDVKKFLSVLDKDSILDNLQHILTKTNLTLKKTETLLNFTYQSKIFGKKLDWIFNPVNSSKIIKLFNGNTSGISAFNNLYSILQTSYTSGIGSVNKDKLNSFISEVITAFKDTFDKLKQTTSKKATITWSDANTIEFQNGINLLIWGNDSSTTPKQKNDDVEKIIDSLSMLSKLLITDFDTKESIAKTNYFDSVVLKEQLTKLMISGFDSVTKDLYKFIFNILLKGNNSISNKVILLKDKFTDEFINVLSEFTFKIMNKGHTSFSEFKMSLQNAMEKPFSSLIKKYLSQKGISNYTSIFDFKISDFTKDPKIISGYTKSFGGDKIELVIQEIYNRDKTKIIKFLKEITSELITAFVDGSLNIQRIMTSISAILKKGFSKISVSDYENILGSLHSIGTTFSLLKTASSLVPKGTIKSLETFFGKSIDDVIQIFKNIWNAFGINADDPKDLITAQATVLHNIFTKGIYEYTDKEFQMMWNVLTLIKLKGKVTTFKPYPTLIKSLFIDRKAIKDLSAKNIKTLLQKLKDININIGIDNDLADMWIKIIFGKNSLK